MTLVRTILCGPMSQRQSASGVDGWRILPPGTHTKVAAVYRVRSRTQPKRAGILPWISDVGMATTLRTSLQKSTQSLGL